MGASSGEDRAATPSEPSPRVSGVAGIPCAGRRASLSVYAKPRPARLVLAHALGISVEEAGRAISALIEGGYGVAPRNPTNGMLAAYIEATEPPKHHEGVITAIGKARVRWQAMMEQGMAMAMSRKCIPRGESDATRITPIAPCDENGGTVVSLSRAKGGHARASKLSPERRSEIARQAANARWDAR
jgi:hypothetical protein